MRLTALVATLLGIVALVASIPADARAMCARESVESWPEPGSTIPANQPLLILEGYGNARDVVRDVGRQSPELVSSDHRVSLEVVEVLGSQMRLNQVVLRAQEDLNEGSTYRLDRDEFTVDQYGLALAGAGDSSEPPEWTAGSVDDRAPLFVNAVEYAGNSYKRFGCGPATYAEVDAELVDDTPSEVSYRVRLEPVDGAGEVQEFWILSAGSGEVAIGHGMCSGEFDLEPGKSYRATLQAVDRAGNRSSTTDEIEVLGPEPN